MSASRSLVTPTAHPELERALQEKLQRRAGHGGGLGRLDALALRLGLIQQRIAPRIDEPHLLVFAADHGMAVDGAGAGAPCSTAEMAAGLLEGQFPASAFARVNGIELTVVDAGIADRLVPHARLLARKIAHGTRNARLSAAMSLEQAHAAIRAGIEIADALRGDLVACAGIGVGSQESAALLLARLAGLPVREFAVAGPQADEAAVVPLMTLLQSVQQRHRDSADPVEAIAAFGGFEIAMMVGLVLQAANRRRAILVDGLAACAAVLAATRIAPAVVDYCIYCRSTAHRGLDRALALLGAEALPGPGLESVDGTGAALAVPLLRGAVALLGETTDGATAAAPAGPDAAGGDGDGGA